MLKLIIVCALGLGLSGCVVVGSDNPLFSQADARGAALRPGVWSIPDDNCQFDPTQPLAKWPSCGNPTVVEGGRIKGGFGKADKAPQSIAYVLAAGDPVVMQLEAPDDRKPDDPRYVYAAVQPERTDASGRIVEAHIWLVLCFKPPLDASGPTKPHPYPGLVMRQGASFCRASNPGPVRDAARLSRDASVKGLKAGDKTDKFWLAARWIRDAE